MKKKGRKTLARKRHRVAIVKENKSRFISAADKRRNQAGRKRGENESGESANIHPYRNNNNKTSSIPPLFLPSTGNKLTHIYTPFGFGNEHAGKRRRRSRECVCIIRHIFLFFFSSSLFAIRIKSYGKKGGRICMPLCSFLFFSFPATTRATKKKREVGNPPLLPNVVALVTNASTHKA